MFTQLYHLLLCWSTIQYDRITIVLSLPKQNLACSLSLISVWFTVSVIACYVLLDLNPAITHPLFHPIIVSVLLGQQFLLDHQFTLWVVYNADSKYLFYFLGNNNKCLHLPKYNWKKMLCVYLFLFICERIVYLLETIASCMFSLIWQILVHGSMFNSNDMLSLVKCRWGDNMLLVINNFFIMYACFFFHFLSVLTEYIHPSFVPA
jgi:hypothetical protein